MRWNNKATRSEVEELLGIWWVEEEDESEPEPDDEDTPDWD